MATKASKRKEKFKLESTAILPNGEPSKHFYTITALKSAEKLELKKYDPRVRKHVLYKQVKLK